MSKYQLVSGRTPDEARDKAGIRLAQWNSQFERLTALQQRRSVSQSKREYAELQKQEADAQTAEATELTDALANTLGHMANCTNTNPIERMREYEPFQLVPPSPVKQESIPQEPNPNDPFYDIKVGFFSSLIPLKAHRLRREAEAQYENDRKCWVNQRDTISKRNAVRNVEYASKMAEWERAKKQNYDANYAHEAAYNDFLENVRASEAEAVGEYFSFLIENADWPEPIGLAAEAVYVKETGILAIDCELPDIEEFPKIKAYKYVASKDSIEAITHKREAVTTLYDKTIYQVLLATIWLIIRFDDYGLVKSVAVNGWVSYTSKSTGMDEKACIASIHTSKEHFQLLQLDRVDAKACFRHLKGVANPNIHEFTPIKPIINFNRNDKRFVSNHNVLVSMEQGTNLAAIGWEEFEHLIREVFEREFSRDGGEVRVTQASRDGGVDAVVFDPDPIRGGKIVIQAKRYTNTVDVSAVRDLFGTMHNEGAMKGILVTTSSFGHDSYNFAKDKPITLIDGNNLLFLMVKQGHNVRIDLAEAKKLGVALTR